MSVDPGELIHVDDAWKLVESETEKLQVEIERLRAALLECETTIQRLRLAVRGE